MKYALMIPLVLLALSQASAGTLLSDDFNRGSLNTNDKDWQVHIETPSSGEHSSISNNQLVIHNGSGDGDNFAYIDLGNTLETAVVSGVVNFDLTNGSTSLYFGLNATSQGIHSGDGNHWHTDGKGYGVQVRQSDYHFMDETRHTSNSLESGSVSLNSGQDYHFELTYDEQQELEVRLWQGQVSDRPTNASFSYNGPVTQPQGTHLAFGITDEGSANIDNLTVTSGSAVPEPSSWILVSMASLFVGGLLRRNRA